MPNQESVDLIVYRVRESGLEVFLVNKESGTSDSEQTWETLTANSTPEDLARADGIELGPIHQEDGTARRAIAIEADWHELPSLRALIYEDYRVAKEKARERLRSLFPDIEKGAYFAIKEALKRVLPEQYAFLKELKEVLIEKNSTRYL
ncbi:MAG: hypothetical protein NZM43_06700 [Saprospiraceae bacterium]|nr:hypothetical protein [Saprospiraceae bacterium]MDW8484000.1 hypothetical protein [Saprospiraceae bacterium]